MRVSQRSIESEAALSGSFAVRSTSNTVNAEKKKMVAMTFILRVTHYIINII